MFHRFGVFGSSEVRRTSTTTAVSTTIVATAGPNNLAARPGRASEARPKASSAGVTIST